MARPVGEVYDAWSGYEDFPRFMGAVASVRPLDERSSHWVVVIGRERREFGAVVTEQVPDRHIAWECRGRPHHEGLVNFRALPGDRTRVTVVLEWEPEGLFDRVGDRLGLVRREVERSLEAFRDHVEQLDVLPAGRRTEIPGHTAAGASPADGVVDANRAAAAEAGRGRTADSPTEIPPAGWLDILKRTMKQLKSDNVPIIAGGVAFYLFLALLPALAAVISIYGLVADPSDVTRQLDDFLGALPRDAADFLESQITEITEAAPGGLGLGVVISVLGALWSASKGMQSLVTALNVAYDEEETRKFLKLRGLALALTVGAAVGAAVLIGGMSVLGAVSEELGTAGELALTIVRWPVLALLLMALLACLYRYAPDRDAPRWRWVSPGAVTAVVLWVLGSFGFSLYVNNFGSYNETYGTLAAIVVLLLWLFLSAYIIVLGAELDAETERQTARDSTVGRSQPLGVRRAYAADTVAPSA